MAPFLNWNKISVKVEANLCSLKLIDILFFKSYFIILVCPSCLKQWFFVFPYIFMITREKNHWISPKSFSFLANPHYVMVPRTVLYGNIGISLESLQPLCKPSFSVYYLGQFSVVYTIIILLLLRKWNRNKRILNPK